MFFLKKKKEEPSEKQGKLIITCDGCRDTLCEVRLPEWIIKLLFKKIERRGCYCIKCKPTDIQ